MLTIGMLAKLFDISTHQIRYYEEVGLFLPTTVDENGYRKYDDSAVYRLTSIIKLREVDFSTEEINSLLENNNDATLIHQKIDALAVKIEHLLDMKRQLEASVEPFKKERNAEIESNFLLKKIGKYQHHQDFNVLDVQDAEKCKAILMRKLYYFFDENDYHVYVKDSRGEKEIAAGKYHVVTMRVSSAEVFTKKYMELVQEKNREATFVIQKEKLLFTNVDEIEFDAYFEEV